MDAQAAQQRYNETIATQRTLEGMSDEPGRYRRQDPMMALINQAWRAQTGQGDSGFNAMQVPF